MAIKASDAIRVARSLIGTPYSEIDCINLIKKVIRTAPGGAKDYTTAGTNTLWDSYESSGKYRDLTWRQSGIAGAKAGMLAFKTASLNDVSHVGIVTSDGTVIHSSSTYGGRGVVETPLTASEGWTLLGIHKHIDVAESAAERQETAVTAYKAQVVLSDESSTLNVRNEPGRGGDIINKLFNGQHVTVQAAFENGWVFVTYGDSGKSGYVSGEYIVRDDTPEEEPENILRVSGVPVIVDGQGNEFFPVGGWHVEFRKED
jgi:hypothetical protein